MSCTKPCEYPEMLKFKPRYLVERTEGSDNGLVLAVSLTELAAERS